MKKIFYFTIVMALGLAMTACSKASKLESKAYEQMELTIKEMAMDAKSVSFMDEETVYSDDSLCIIHANMKAKNGLGIEITQKLEYIYINSNGKNYESFSTLSQNNGVYATKEDYDKNKKGEIYEKLPYEAGMRYLATLKVVDEGREVGVKEPGLISIPVSTGTGYWGLNNFSDDFGEKSAEKYIALKGKGVFSNSATTRSEMSACLFADGNLFSFKFVEYNFSTVTSEDKFKFKIKDSTGKVHEMTLQNTYTGQMMSIDKKDHETLTEILKKGGVITISAEEVGKYYSTLKSTYVFKMDVTGYTNALKYL